MCVLGRSMTAENPTVSDLRDERQWEPMGFQSNRTTSGAIVTPENALTVSAYYDGIRIISEDIGKLPFTTFRRLDPRGREKAPEHPVYPLLKRAPNENMSAMSFRESMTGNAISWGGGFALIERNGRGVPQRLDIVHPSRVRTDLDSQGRIFYEVGVNKNKTSIQTMIVRQADMFHLHGLSNDGVTGYSVARIGAESLGRAMSQDRFSSSFFKNGSSPKGAIRVMKKFRDKAEMDRLRMQWREDHTGPDGWHTPLILEQGSEWQTITIPPEEAQMIESQQFSVLDIARWLRLAPHKLAHLADATFSNVEEMNIDHVNDTLMPWAVRWEQEAERKLFIGEEDEFFAKHNFEALLRGNSEARSKFLREMFNIGAVSQNDVREKLDMNPIGEEGDVYYIQGQMIRSEDAAEGATNASDEPPAGRMDGFENEPNQPEQRQAVERRDAMLALIDNALARCNSKESLAWKNVMKKHGGDSEALNKWLQGFRKKHRDYVFDSVLPVAVSIAGIFGTKVNQSTVSLFATEYVADSDGPRRHSLVRKLLDMIVRRRLR